MEQKIKQTILYFTEFKSGKIYVDIVFCTGSHGLTQEVHIVLGPYNVNAFWLSKTNLSSILETY